jgi:hypothetical protein
MPQPGSRPAGIEAGMWKVAELAEVDDLAASDWPAGAGAEAGLLTGAHVRRTGRGEVWLDLRAVEDSFWQETRLMLAGVTLK